MDELFPTLTPPSSFIYNHNIYKNQANMDISHKYMIRVIWRWWTRVKKNAKSGEVVVFLLHWELMWGGWLQVLQYIWYLVSLTIWDYPMLYLFIVYLIYLLANVKLGVWTL